MTRFVSAEGALAHASTPLVPPACLNCGGPVPGHFCGHCGQDAHTHRYTLGHVLHEIPHTVLHVDKGLLYTAKELVLRPAPTLRSFLAGQRAPHFRPLAYVLLLAGVSAFLYTVLHLRPYLPDDPNVGPAGRQLQAQMADGTAKYWRWIAVGALPLTAFVAWRLLRRAAFTYAEWLVVNAYLLGTASLITMPFFVPYYLFNGTARMNQVSLCSSAVLIAYQTWAYAGLLAPAGRSALRRYARGLLTAVLSAGALMLLFSGVMYALNWSTAKESFREIKQLSGKAQKRSTSSPASSPSTGGTGDR